ncbi:MAG: hypothetical protein QME57_00500 [Patescibacteria group bacterium]|nr:hypothetical protein [Patescibacteria group bacterium]
MKFIADFHLHSKYSRATSRNMDLESLDKLAKIKGIKVLGTGDYTHPEWLKNLKEKLEPAEPGLFKLKDTNSETRFILTTEVSCVYSKKNRVRKIHIIVFAPSFEIVEKINTHLGWIGNLKADGRPILGLDAKELTKIVLNISEDCLIVPAHCLLPDTFLHCNPGLKMIKDISIGDLVYAHNGRYQKVQKVYKRPYKGKIINVKPYYFRIGLKTTPEHPFFGIKSHKYCPTMGCKTICQKNCAFIKRRRCPHRYFENYQPQWIQAKDIEKGDVLIFPRFNDITKDIKEIRLSSYLSRKQFKVFENKVTCTRGRIDKKLPNIIKIDKAFCRLIGYYISEGYTDNRDSISFCFKRNERKYIRDLKFLMKKIFGLTSPRIYERKNADSLEIIYFSKILAKVFSKLFYNSLTVKKACTKCLPFWMLNLPLEKQVEIFQGWWRGDSGVTSSRELMNQMKIILLRLGIIPSISAQTAEDFNKSKHKIENRTIKAQGNLFYFHNLSFFKDLFKLLRTPEFKKFKTKLTRRHGWLDKKYIYIPVRNIEIKNYEGEVYNLEVAKDNSYVAEFATIHNCWTPWFSLFGSRSGFDSIEECFEDYSKYIYAGETGLSSNPAMNWRLSALDKITLISCSDAHSPVKIGREANVFDTELSYFSIIETIKSKDPQKFLYTIEFFPQEGKYHYDGHRLCGIRLSPQESKKSGNICPNCGRPLTIGVLNRVEELANRPEGFKPENAIPFKSLIPLEEIIADALGVMTGTRRVEEEYKNLIDKFGSEFNVLLDVSRSELEKATLSEIAEGIIRVREGKVYIEPGYDGVYGKIRIFSPGEQKTVSRQKTLF